MKRPRARNPRRVCGITFALVFAFILLLPALGHAPFTAAQQTKPSSGTVTVPALAVTQTAQGLIGVPAQVQATVLGNGTGQVYVATKPLAAADMQGSARVAAQVAASTLGLDWRRYDYLIQFTSDTVAIGGPSAGGEMALALTTALHNLENPDDLWVLDPRVAGTGTINPDGTIGPVGGVPAKAEAAATLGVTLFLYPAGLETATTLVPGGIFGLQVVEIDMASHCAQLNLTCRPVASLRELLEEAAGIQFTAPQPPLPGTTDYGPQLEPTVSAQLSALAARLAALDLPAIQNARANMTAAQIERIAAELQQARIRFDAATSALAGHRYYLAATETFQGSLAAGRAEVLVEFYSTSLSESVVQTQIQRCRDAIAAANETVGDTPTTLNALYALGAAQQRFAEAEELLADAQARYAAAFRFEDWVLSMFSANFCTERAATVTWWADLQGAFGPGPAIADLDAMSQETLDQAADLVGYAQAVEQQGGMAGASEAAATLELAQALAQSGRTAAAIVLGIAAQSQASVELQTAGGSSGVPEAVLQAAREAASRAIDEARNRGAEPMSSVSLVELSAEQEPAQALHSLWTARGLALLDATTLAPRTEVTSTPPSAIAAPLRQSQAALLPSLLMGALVGAALVTALWGLVPPGRR